MESRDYIIDIKEAAPSEEYYKDNWYVVLPNNYYKLIFGKTVKKTGNLPWKRRVIKIYSGQTKKSIYRIYKGSFRAKSKTEDDTPILRLTPDAARVLKAGDHSKTPVQIRLTKGSKFMFYWRGICKTLALPNIYARSIA